MNRCHLCRPNDVIKPHRDDAISDTWSVNSSRQSNTFRRQQTRISLATGRFPSQRASNAENVSIWWCHHEIMACSWASYQIRKIAGCACAGNAGNVFPRRRFQRKSLVNDPGMHHGTCVTHVPWCMSGSFTCGDGENVPGIPGACAPAILRIWQEAHGQIIFWAHVGRCCYIVNWIHGNLGINSSEIWIKIQSLLSHLQHVFNPRLHPMRWTVGSKFGNDRHYLPNLNRMMFKGNVISTHPYFPFKQQYSFVNETRASMPSHTRCGASMPLVWIIFNNICELHIVLYLSKRK